MKTTRARLPTAVKTFSWTSNVWKIFFAASLIATPLFAAGDAESLFQEGRSALQKYSREPNDPADLRAAERAFAQAQQADPKHAGACWFHLSTRFQLLSHDPEMNDTLTRLGLETTGRNPVQWKARAVYPLPASGQNLADLFALLDSKLGPEIDRALAELEEIPPSWGDSVYTVSSEDSDKLQKPMQFGLAEISMVKFALHAGKAALLAGRMYALDAPVDGWLASNPDRTLQVPGGILLKTLAESPTLFTVKDPGVAAEARMHLDEAVKNFHIADRLVRTRDPAETNATISVSMMDQLRPFAMSLLGPSRVEFTREDSSMLNLRRLFEAPLPGRHLLPEFTADNAIRLGTFPDPTFGGIMPDMTATRLNDYLRWNRAASETSNDLFAVRFAGGRFVAVGDRGTVLTSPDGLAWTKRATSTEAALKGVAYGAGGWVAVGARGTILTSSDGASWTAVDAGVSDDLEAVVKGGPGWVAVGQNGAVVFSGDGERWARASAPVANHLWCVTWARSRFVAAGSKGTSTTSTDGKTWSEPDGAGGESIVALAESGWEIRGATYEGKLLSSLDGRRWQPLSASTNFAEGLWGIFAGPAEQVAVGNQGLVYLSPNGRDWVRQVTRSYEAFRGAAEGDGRYVVVGTKGRILHGYATMDRAIAFFQGDTGEILRQVRQGAPMVQAKHASTLGVAAGAILLERPNATEESTLDTFLKRTAPPNTPPLQNSTTPSSSLSLLTPGPVSPGERIRVKVLATVDPKKAWVAFYRGDDAEDRAYVTYTFFNNLRDATYDVNAPEETGSYHFRLFKDDGYECIGRSGTVEVR